MYLAKVVGTVVATRKVDGLDGVRLLVVEPVGEDGRPVDVQQVATDAVQAGPGELVYVCTGREASMALDEQFVPVDLAIVGHVDDVDFHAAALVAGTSTTAKPRAKGASKRRRR